MHLSTIECLIGLYDHLIEVPSTLVWEYGMAKYNSEHKSVIDKLLLDNPDVHTGKMFGYPAYYVGRKMCICLYEQSVGIKLPEESARRLIETDPDVILFQPMGRPRMREWVQINLSRSEEYKRYIPVFDESIAYALTKQEKKGSAE